MKVFTSRIGDFISSVRYVLHVLHHLFVQREIVKSVVDESPPATMNDVLPSSMFTITPVLP